LVKLEVLAGIIPKGTDQSEIINNIKAGNYEKVLFKYMVYLLRDLNERVYLPESIRVLLIDKTLDLLEKYMNEPRDIIVLTKEFTDILIRYLKAIELDAINKKNVRHIQWLENEANSLKEYLKKNGNRSE